MHKIRAVDLALLLKVIKPSIHLTGNIKGIIYDITNARCYAHDEHESDQII